MQGLQIARYLHFWLHSHAKFTDRTMFAFLVVSLSPHFLKVRLLKFCLLADHAHVRLGFLAIRFFASLDIFALFAAIVFFFFRAAACHVRTVFSLLCLVRQICHVLLNGVLPLLCLIRHGIYVLLQLLHLLLINLLLFGCPIIDSYSLIFTHVFLFRRCRCRSCNFL